MTNEEFNEWRGRLGLTYKAAATALGTSERSVYNYAGKLEIPLFIELACFELERRNNETFGRPLAWHDFSVNTEARTIEHARTGVIFYFDENDVIRPRWAGTVPPHMLPRFAEIAAEALRRERAFNPIRG